MEEPALNIAADLGFRLAFSQLSEPTEGKKFSDFSAVKSTKKIRSFAIDRMSIALKGGRRRRNASTQLCYKSRWLRRKNRRGRMVLSCRYLNSSSTLAAEARTRQARRWTSTEWAGHLSSRHYLLINSNHSPTSSQHPRVRNTQ